MTDSRENSIRFEKYNKVKQSELAKQLGISKSYLSMIVNGKRIIPEHLRQPISEFCEQKQYRKVTSNQRVSGSNPARDTILVSFAAIFFLQPLQFILQFLQLLPEYRFH